MARACLRAGCVHQHQQTSRPEQRRGARITLQLRNRKIYAANAVPLLTTIQMPLLASPESTPTGPSWDSFAVARFRRSHATLPMAFHIRRLRDSDLPLYPFCCPVVADLPIASAIVVHWHACYLGYVRFLASSLVVPLTSGRQTDHNRKNTANLPAAYCPQPKKTLAGGQRKQETIQARPSRRFTYHWLHACFYCSETP